LTSRLEGLNKYYGTEILASQRVRELAQDSYVFRSIDIVRPQGVRIEFPIFELMGSRDELAEGLLNELLLWEEACSLYREGKWEEALPIFEERAHVQPLDRVATLYVTRCRHLIAEPPPGPWNGVEIFDKK
jgi:adenylate cyclase